MASNKKESASAKAPSETLSIEAGKNGRAIAIFLFVTIIAALGDLGSKHLVFKQMLTDPTLETRVVDLLDHPGVEVEQTEEFSRAVLQELPCLTHIALRNELVATIYISRCLC